MKTELSKIIAVGCCLTIVLWAQPPGRFVQAELDASVNTKSAKPGDPVRAHAITGVVLQSGVKISKGSGIFGQVRAVDPTSLAISFDEVELDGKRTPLTLSIRAARAPGENAKPSPDQPANAGMLIGMPGVTLQLNDAGPSRFVSSGKKLLLKQGLQLMLGAKE